VHRVITTPWEWPDYKRVGLEVSRPAANALFGKRPRRDLSGGLQGGATRV
jgi:hypothetical protein